MTLGSQLRTPVLCSGKRNTTETQAAVMHKRKSSANGGALYDGCLWRVLCIIIGTQSLVSSVSTTFLFFFNRNYAVNVAELQLFPFPMLYGNTDAADHNRSSADTHAQLHRQAS